MQKPCLILIIEDDPELGKTFKEILEFEGFETEIVNDGAQAYPAVASRIPALVMLDMHLPNASGLEILKQIRGDNQLQQIKILVTTADRDLADVARDGADAVFAKPFRVDQLIATVTRLLD